jgi:hypothetical protein
MDRRPPHWLVGKDWEIMIRRGLKLFMPVLPFAVIFTVSAEAQTAASAPLAPRANTMVPVYDLTKEVKIQGTIQKIDGFGTSGPIGTHVLLETSSGALDAHLGFGAASSPKYLGIAPGQNVTVTGMMETIGATNVLMARILTTPNHIFVLRNEHGIPVRAIPGGSLSPKGSTSLGFANLNAEARAGSGFAATNARTPLGGV